MEFCPNCGAMLLPKNGKLECQCGYSDDLSKGNNDNTIVITPIGFVNNKVLNEFQDSLAEFFVQIYQNGEDYRIVFTNSNKYSEKMIEDFKDTYISVLSKIINADMSSDLNFIV